MKTLIDLRKEGLVELRDALAKTRYEQSRRDGLQNAQLATSKSAIYPDMVGASGEVAAARLLGGVLQLTLDPGRSRPPHDLILPDGRRVEVKCTTNPLKGLSVPAWQKDKSDAEVYVLLLWSELAETVKVRGWVPRDSVFAVPPTARGGYAVRAASLLPLAELLTFSGSKRSPTGG